MIIEAANHCASLALNATYPLRALLYLLTPGETYFELEEHVPHLSIQSMGLFTGFIIIENIIAFAKHGRLAGNVSDTLTSVGSGLLSLVPKYNKTLSQF
jgi:hypothetical protein